MTLPLAKHLGERGITVNTIMPGYTKTDINAKLLDDSEIRNSLLRIHLCSNE